MADRNINTGNRVGVFSKHNQVFGRATSKIWQRSSAPPWCETVELENFFRFVHSLRDVLHRVSTGFCGTNTYILGQPPNVQKKGSRPEGGRLCRTHGITEPPPAHRSLN
jgi:hypothetical protein